MRKTILLSILMIGLFLILTGCDEQTSDVQVVSAFLGGTQGITAEFQPFGVEDNGVYNVFDTETFPIEVTLRNKGEYKIDINDVTVKLLGPAQEEFSGITSWELKNTEIIDEISELVPEGGEQTIIFSNEAKYETGVTGLVDRVLFANIDYNYQTYLIIPEVCLKENLNDDRVCKVKEGKNFFVSGAPITIKSVEETTSGRGIMALKIKISNVAGGKVAKISDDFGVYDKLSYTLDDDSWQCQSGGKINEARLLNGEAEIICKLKNSLDTGTIATKQLKLTLDYQYRDIVQETLRIKQSN